MLKRLLTITTHKIFQLPVLVLMPHSRCNCRCVMCDIWKANHEKREITVEEMEKHMGQFLKLQVREVALSGGEALMHSNLWKLCSLFKQHHIRISLLSTGLLLEKHAKEIVAHCDEVIVSLDGSPVVHDKIRNIPLAFAKLQAGVKALKTQLSDFQVSGRCVLQRYNYFDFPNIIQSAKKIGLDRISFLPADVSSSAFHRPEVWNDERVRDVALDKVETNELDVLIRNSFSDFRAEYESRFISEHPEKMLRIVQYYRALNGVGAFPKVVCNAPWVSAVIEADGAVMPCYFHRPYGNVNEKDFLGIINSPEAISFRKKLNIQKDPICQKCVCSLKLGLTKLN